MESQHFREKKEQCFKKGPVQEVIATLKSLVTRQEDDKIRAIHGSGRYWLSRPFKKFEVDSVKWHGMDPCRRMNHVEQFRKYCRKWKTVSKNLHPVKERRTKGRGWGNLKQKLSWIEWKAGKVKIQDPNIARKVVYELHLRSMVPRKVERCQGNCGVKLEPSDEANNDYLVVKSFGTSTFMVKGESHSKYGPRYVHFQRDCLK